MKEGEAREWGPDHGLGLILLEFGSPGALEEPLLRDEPFIDHLLLLPLTTHSYHMGLGTFDAPPQTSPPRALPGQSVTFNEIHQRASWLDLLHLPCFVCYGRRHLKATKEVSVNGPQSLQPPFLGSRPF